jgi:DNA-binding transcriptional regulator YiaG
MNLMRNWTIEEIKDLRRAIGISQHDFAELLGVTEQHIYYLERGAREPSQTLRLLLDCVEEKHKRKRKRKGE